MIPIGDAIWIAAVCVVAGFLLGLYAYHTHPARK